MKTKSILGTLKLAVAVILAVPTIASASIIASETFESYSTGPLSGQGSGTGWTGNWTAPGGVTRAEVVDTTGNPLAFTPGGGLPVEGATRAFEVALTGAPASQLCGVRTLAAPISQTFYVGYLVRHVAGVWAGANNTFTLHLGTNNNSTTTLNFGLRGNTAAGSDEFLIRYATAGPVAGASTGGQLVTGTDYYLVAKVTHSGAAFTSASLWLNPTATDEVDTPNGDASLTGFSSLPITHVFFRQAVLDADDVLRADEIRIGTEWIDVVTYPAGPKIPEVRVETAADGSGTVVPAQNITAGNSITMYAIARDQGGNYLSNAPATWSVENVTGGIVSGNLVQCGDEKSAVFTAAAVGTANVRASAYATNLVASGTLTVVAGPASQVRVETEADGNGTLVPAQSVASGGAGAITVYSISRDASGNFLGNVLATWSLQNKTSGVVDGDLAPASGTSATFTGNLSGTANIRATSGALTAVDSGLITVSRAVTWVGGGANPWDFSTANWTTGSPVTFLDSDDVTFDGGGSQSPAVNITATVKPNSINVNGGAYTFGGSGGISGVSSLTNFSGSPLILLTTNDYTGLTVMSFGDLQLGNGVQNGSLGSGNVLINTGGTSPIFNRTDTVAAPYVVSNTISGIADFYMEFKSGAVTLAGAASNIKAKAIVRNGATLILSKTGTGVDIGVNTATSGTNLIIEAGGKVMLGLQSSGGDHITAAGRYIQIDGTFDVNGVNEAYGVIQGTGIIDNTGVSNAVLTVNQGSSTAQNGGLPLGNGGEVFTFEGVIRNTGTGTLGITKDGTNTLILAKANTYGGDTRIITGGILELGHINSMQNSTLDRPSGDTGNLSFGSLTSANLGGLKGARGFALENVNVAAVALNLGANGQNNTFSGVLSGGGSLTKSGPGIQTLSGTNTYTGTTTVSAGTLLVNGGLAGGAVAVSASATLGGNRAIGGTVTVNGTLRPGNNNLGTLTVNNSVGLQPGSTTVVELNRTSTPNSDRLAATSITLGGSLVVTNIGGTLQGGDSFILFTGTLSGSITPVTLPALGPGMSWDTSALNSAGTISVIGAATPPTISAVALAGGNLVLTVSGGVADAIYYVINSPNVTAPLSTWTRVATNQFTADGKFTNAIPVNPGVPQSFFTVEVP